MAENLARKTKWDAYAEIIDTTTPSKRATFDLTVQHALGMLGDKREGSLLDIGCGFGEIDVLLAKQTSFKITGCDISDKCIDGARKNVNKAGMENRICIEKGDVYKLKYPDNYFDVIVSFGYTSAATYKGVQGEVARVLKPGGILICDFINYLCLYKIMRLQVGWNKMIREEGKYYNIATVKGMKEYFARHNLNFISQSLFNTYPPLDFLSKGAMIFFERSIGSIFRRVLGRVRLVCFQKTNEN